jgi:anaerobic selenocysteine-containing dehydrogenase
MINVIVTNQIGDCDFVQKYVVGCLDLPEAMKEYTPQWAEGITGVPAATIDRIAREFAAAGKHALATRAGVRQTY